MDDLEIYYIRTSHISMIAVTFITAVCFVSLVKPFLMKKKYAWTVGAVYFGMMNILYCIPVQMNNFTAYGLGVLTAFAFTCNIDRRNYGQKLFLSLTFFSLRWLALAMENCIDKMLYYESLKVPGYSKSQKLQLEIFIGCSILDVILSFLFLSVFVWLINRAYTYKYADVTGKEVLLLSMPSVLGMVGYEVLKYYEKVYESRTGSSLFDLYGTYDWLCFLYYGIMMTTILVVIILFQDLKGRQEEETQNKLLARQMEDMKNHIEEVERLYRDFRSLRHDIGNHVMTLENLYVKREYGEARKYTMQLQKKLNELPFAIKSGNPVTDVILMERKKEAQEEGIDFICEFHYPEGTGINAFDVSVILNNGIGNALEAASKCQNPFVKISSYRRKNAYLIEIRNNYSNEFFIDEKNGLPVTTKQSEKGHGLGLANIKKTAQKYHGDMDIAYDEKIFVLSVMLMSGT